MSSEDLDLQYSPSKWSLRYSAEEVMNNHIKFITKVSAISQQHIPCELNVQYGEDDREKLDIFGTDLPQDSPLFIYIHGGFWQCLCKELSSYVVQPLYKNGFKVLIIGYTLCPEVKLSDIIKQIQRSFLKCIDYAKVNGASTIYMAGHSAGAHLVANLFNEFFLTLSESDRSLLKKVFLISGVYDLTPLTKTYVNEALKLDSITSKKLSPLYQPFVGSNIQFYIIVGEHDSPAFKIQSELFYKKLYNLHYTAELHIIKGVDHFNIVEQLNDENFTLIHLILNKEQ